jgi:hypothetical protein
VFKRKTHIIRLPIQEQRLTTIHIKNPPHPRFAPANPFHPRAKN